MEYAVTPTSALSVPNFSAALLILNPIVDLSAVNVAQDKTKLKIHTEAVPINWVPKDVSGLVIGTTKVPKIPANICTGIAPTTSSKP